MLKEKQEIKKEIERKKEMGPRRDSSGTGAILLFWGRLSFPSLLVCFLLKEGAADDN